MEKEIRARDGIGFGIGFGIGNGIGNGIGFGIGFGIGSGLRNGIGDGIRNEIELSQWKGGGHMASSSSYDMGQYGGEHEEEDNHDDNKKQSRKREYFENLEKKHHHASPKKKKKSSSFSQEEEEEELDLEEDHDEDDGVEVDTNNNMYPLVPIKKKMVVKRYMRPSEEARSYLRHVPSMFRNPWEWYIKRTNSILRRYKLHMENLVKLQSSAKPKFAELEKEIVKIKETKLELRYIVREVWLETGSILELPKVNEDDVSSFSCCVCKSSDADGSRGDIIICDHDMCGKAFHQACQVPVICTSSSLYDPSKPFYCRRCRCFFALLNLINDEFGTDVNDWESLFPEIDEEFSQQSSSDNNNNNNDTKEHDFVGQQRAKPNNDFRDHNFDEVSAAELAAQTLQDLNRYSFT